MEILILILFILLGFFLIFLEILILPGLITGIIGGGIILFTLIYSFVKHSFEVGLLILIFSIVLALVLIILVKKLKLWDKFILRHNQLRDLGYIATPDIKDLLGKRGIAITDLRPSGIILIDGKRYQAQSEGEYIPSNSKIEVINSIGQTIIVKKEEV